MKYTQVDPVTVSLSDLQSSPESIPFSALTSAFGPSSLGILVVRDLPDSYNALRRKLLTYARLLGSLPASSLQRLECAEAKYLVGWSCGKERLSKDRVDTLKGSFYVNCAFHKDRSLDGAQTDGQERFERLKEYTQGNVWPDEGSEEFRALKGFRETFEQLCSLIIDTAALVARACDLYALKNIPDYEKGYLERIVRTSTTTKARLLHYFPPPEAGGDAEEDDLDSWCGTHLDHGCLTGLTSAMYSSLVNPDEEISSPDPDAGLYIKNRLGETVKVAIPSDRLAFQTGEALERITRGQFKAVPHFVRGARSKLAKGVSRSTLAVFTQPNLWEVVDREEGVEFAEFARRIVERNTSEGM